MNSNVRKVEQKKWALIKHYRYISLMIEKPLAHRILAYNDFEVSFYFKCIRSIDLGNLFK